MKKLLCLLMSIATLLSLCACNSNDTEDEEKEEKMVTVWLLSEQNVYKNGEITDRYSYTYDDKGNMTKASHYYKGELENHCEYLYDSKGALTESVWYADDLIVLRYSDKETGKIHAVEYNGGGAEYLHCYYDNAGNISEEVMILGGRQVEHTTYTYTFDENGKLSQKVTCINGFEKDSRTYRYNSDGNLTEEIVYGSGTENSRYTYYFDMDNRLIRSIFYENGEESSRSEYSYDSKGRITERAVKTADFEEYTVVYDYLSVQVTPEEARELQENQRKIILTGIQ